MLEIQICMNNRGSGIVRDKGIEGAKLGLLSSKRAAWLHTFVSVRFQHDVAAQKVYPLPRTKALQY